MAQYYILSNQCNVDAIYEQLSVMLPPDTVTVTLVNDNSGILPAKYICITTELLSDTGLVHMVKQITNVYCNDKKIRFVKELEGRTPLV